MFLDIVFVSFCPVYGNLTIETVSIDLVQAGVEALLAGDFELFFAIADIVASLD